MIESDPKDIVKSFPVLLNSADDISNPDSAIVLYPAASEIVSVP